MIIFPAIDIQNGQCVRLVKGDFATAEQVADDPLKTALKFAEAGAKWLHMVDLDGAKTATQPNKLLFLQMAKETELKIELGGGIRDYATAAAYLDNGIERVILGSAAVKNPRLVADLVKDYGDRIAVGIDAKAGVVQTEGWITPSRANFLTMARTMQEIGVHHIIYTDIARDGMLGGPNIEDLKKLKNAVKLNIIASGGVSGISDIEALKRLSFYGVICGKALYSGDLDLAGAIKIAGSQEPVIKDRPENEAQRLSEESAESEQTVKLGQSGQLGQLGQSRQSRQQNRPSPQQAKPVPTQGQAQRAKASRYPQRKHQRNVEGEEID